MMQGQIIHYYADNFFKPFSLRIYPLTFKMFFLNPLNSANIVFEIIT